MFFRRPKVWDLPENAATPEQAYLDRRALMRGAGAGAATLALMGCGEQSRADEEDGDALPPVTKTDEGLYITNESDRPRMPAAVNTQFADGGAEPNSYAALTNYNNFYEFGVDKRAPARFAEALTTDPWSINVTGMVENPRRYAFEDLIDLAQAEQRVYRLRCVEAWSMVVPWIGVPLKAILDRVQPLGSAKYVQFETLYRPDEMVGQRRPYLQWPYVEGLRIDEAANDLAFLAVGLYGRVMPKQNGAPVRLVLPWKYGFKSIKSIVGIHFTEQRPATSWNVAAPSEYGFFANVNPGVSHPRWSQARERRIGEFRRRETLMYNGYGEQVASLYEGMDLARNY